MSKKPILDDFEKDLEANFEHHKTISDAQKEIALLTRTAKEHTKSTKKDSPIKSS